MMRQKDEYYSERVYFRVVNFKPILLRDIKNSRLDISFYKSATKYVKGCCERMKIRNCSLSLDIFCVIVHCEKPYESISFGRIAIRTC